MSRYRWPGPRGLENQHDRRITDVARLLDAQSDHTAAKTAGGRVARTRSSCGRAQHGGLLLRHAKRGSRERSSVVRHRGEGDSPSRARRGPWRLSHFLGIWDPSRSNQVCALPLRRRAAPSGPPGPTAAARPSQEPERS